MRASHISAATPTSIAKATLRPAAPFSSARPSANAAWRLDCPRLNSPREPGMTQPALSRLEAGGVVPTIPLLERITAALDADLIVQIAPHAA